MQGIKSDQQNILFTHFHPIIINLYNTSNAETGMKAVIITVVFLVIGAIAWLVLFHGGGEAETVAVMSAQSRMQVPQVVIVEPVKFVEIVDSIESIGTSHANESIILTTKVTDTVNLVHFEDGDIVEAGKILVEMTNQEESALLAEAQANLDDARRQLDRQQDLGQKGLTANSTIDEAVARADSAKARFNAITARMNDRLIRAPFSGLLGFREISPGTLLTPNTQITTLDDISVIKLDFSVPEVYLGTIKPGYRILARSDTWKDTEFEGVIDSIGSRIDPVTRAVTVRAVIDNQDGQLRPGMLMMVKIITDTRQALVIPESAFIQTGNETHVFLAGDDGFAHRQLIKIGSRRTGYVEVLEGLQEGDPVIIEGGFKLQDNSPYKAEDRSSQEVGLPVQTNFGIPAVNNHVVV